MSLTAAERITYSTREAAEMAGVSYRMLDWWLRQGQIEIDFDAHGSGSRRRWSGHEVAALLVFVARLREMHGIRAAWMDGTLWRQAMTEVRS